jgi:hypothetical protein
MNPELGCITASLKVRFLKNDLLKYWMFSRETLEPR